MPKQDLGNQERLLKVKTVRYFKELEAEEGSMEEEG